MIEIKKEQIIKRNKLNIYSIFVICFEIVTTIVVTVMTLGIIAKLLMGEKYSDYKDILNLLNAGNHDFFEAITISVGYVSLFFSIVFTAWIIVYITLYYMFKDKTEVDVERHVTIQKILNKINKSLTYFITSAYIILNIFQNYSEETRALIEDFDYIATIIYAVLMISIFTRGVRISNALVKKQFVNCYKYKLENCDDSKYIKKEYKNKTIRLVYSIIIFIVVNFIITSI